MILHLLIASFFLLVGAEIRKELEHKKELIAPLLAALGGMVLPALIFRLLQPESARRLCLKYEQECQDLHW